MNKKRSKYTLRNKQRFFICTVVLSFISITLFPLVSADSAVMVCSYVLDASEIILGDNATLTVTIINTERTAIKTTQDGSTGPVYFDPQTGMWYVPEGSTITQTQRDFTAKIRNIWIKSPTKYLTASNNYNNVGEIAPGGSFTVSFQMHADEQLIPGLYFPEVCINVDGGSNVNFPVPIKVTNETVDLLQSDIPSKISMSGITDITLTVVNTLGGPVKNVMVNLISDDDVEISPQKVFIGFLEGHCSREVTFSLKPHTIGQKSFSCNLEFKNSDRIHTKSSEFFTEVIDATDVEIIFQGLPSVIVKGETAEIDLEVFNAKNSAISGVIIIPVSDDITVFPSKYFIGEMNPDDVFSAHFVIQSDRMPEGEHTIGFKVVFKQENDFYETSPVSMDFEVTDSMNHLGSIISQGTTTILLLVVSIVLFFTLFIHFKCYSRMVGKWSKTRSIR